MKIKYSDITINDALEFQNIVGIVTKEKKYLVIEEAPKLEKIQGFIKHNIEINNVHIIAKDKEKIVG